MQKVIAVSQKGEFLSGAKKVGGYLTTAQDSKHLKSLEDVYYGMRLDYNPSPFKLSDDSYCVIRYKATNSSDAYIPKSPINGGSVTDPVPFTGTGFTAASNGRIAVPEWKLDATANMDDGAEFWEISADGTVEVLVAIYSKAQDKFILVP